MKNLKKNTMKLVSFAMLSFLLMIPASGAFNGTIISIQSDSIAVYSGGHTNMVEIESGKAQYWTYGYVHLELVLDIHLAQGWTAEVKIDERTLNDDDWDYYSQNGFISSDLSFETVDNFDKIMTVEYNQLYDYVEDHGTVKFRINVDAPFPDDHRFFVYIYLYEGSTLKSSSHEEYDNTNLIWGYNAGGGGGPM